MHPAIRSVLPALCTACTVCLHRLHHLQSASLTVNNAQSFSWHNLATRQATNPRLWMTTPRRGIFSAGCGSAPTNMKKAPIIFLQNYSDRRNAFLLAVSHMSSILSCTLLRLEMAQRIGQSVIQMAAHTAARTAARIPVQIVVQMPHSTAVINNCQLRHASKLPFPPNLDVRSLLIQ